MSETGKEMFCQPWCLERLHSLYYCMFFVLFFNLKCLSILNGAITAVIYTIVCSSLLLRKPTHGCNQVCFPLVFSLSAQTHLSISSEKKWRWGWGRRSGRRGCTGSTAFGGAPVPFQPGLRYRKRHAVSLSEGKCLHHTQPEVHVLRS